MIHLIKKHLHTHSMQKKWRELNEQNFTFLSLIPDSVRFFEQISIGKKTYGPIWAAWSGNPSEKLVIGRYCSIGSGVKFILGSEHPYKCLTTYPFKVKSLGASYEATTKGPINIADDVWVGEDSLILSGVSVGQGAIIAARSLVTKDVMPYSIVGGNPAKELKKRFEPEIIEILLKKLDFGLIPDEISEKEIKLLYSTITRSNVLYLLEGLQIK